MDKEDIEEFREAIQRMSDEDGEEKKASSQVDDREKLLVEYQHETSQLEQEKVALKIENSLLSSSANIEEETFRSDQVYEAQEVSMAEVQYKDAADENETLPENDHDQDDLYSIFSEDEEDLRSLVEGSDTIRKALRNLRKERDFWIVDTASETSDDGDTSTVASMSARSLRDASADRIQISKLQAEKEFLELKLSQVTNEKKNTETKLKYLEKENSVSKRRQGNQSVISRLDQSEPTRHSPRIESRIQPSKQGDHKKTKEAPKPHTHRQKHSARSGMSNAELMQFLRLRSISPQLVKGYEDDIAILAEENAKLGEIIDHLHLNPEEEQASTRIDPMAAFMDAYEHRVPQDEYMRLESEKMRLEHAVREKDRHIKERDRILEETKFEFEDDVKLLKDALKRMEEKMKQKTREVNEYEIQIIELKSSFEEQLRNAESELEMGNEQNMRLEDINISLVETNKKYQMEIEHLRSSLSTQNTREKEIEKKYSYDLKMLEEKFLNESREKTQLSGNLEGLMSDLMMLKNKLLEDGNKTARMREGFEKERLDLGGEPLDVNPRFANLTLHLRNRGHDERGQTSQGMMMESQAANQQVVAMEPSDIDLSMQPGQQPDLSEYTLLIRQQKDKIEMLERANQEFNFKLVQNFQQQKPLSDVSIVQCDIVKDSRDQSQMPQNVGPEQGTMMRDQNYQLGVRLPEDRNLVQSAIIQDQQDLNNNTSPRPSSSLKHDMDELEQENSYLKNKLEDLGKEKMKRRDLEEKNEELQEEMSQMSRKRTELQRKQDNMSNEIEEMNEKVEQLEKSNAKLTKEADQLTNMIKEMEESFNEEKANLTLSFERERDTKDKELNNAFEKEQERFKEMEEEIEKLQDEINSLMKQNKDLENKYNSEMGSTRGIDDKESEEEIEKMRDEITSLIKQNKDMENKYNNEIENLKRKHDGEHTDNLSQVQGDVKDNSDHLRKVEEQWKIKLENTVHNYEEQLKKAENEKRQLLIRVGIPQGNMNMPQQSPQPTAVQAITDEKPDLDEDSYPIVSQTSVVERELIPEGAHTFTPSYTIESDVPLEDNADESQPEGQTEEREVDAALDKRPNARLFTPSSAISEVPLDDQTVNEDHETVGLAKVMKIDDYVPNKDRDNISQIDNEAVNAHIFTPSYSITEIPFEDEPTDDTPRTTGVRETIQEIPANTPMVLDTKVNVDHKSIHERHEIENRGIEVEYISIGPNLHIQVELEDDDRRERGFQDGRKDEARAEQLELQRAQLQKELNQKQNEILSLTQKIAQLEQQLIGKNGEIALLQEKERNANVVFQNKMEDKTKYYQDLLEKLKTTLQGEKRELEERLNKDSEEMQRLMKEEFQKNLSSKSGMLENKIQDLVADKVKNYKEQIKQLDARLNDEKAKVKQFESGDDERTKRLEREKKVMRATILALSKELNKAKQDRKDIKKEYKKGKAEMQKAAEEERKMFEESLERAKDVQKLKIEEELRSKYSIDVEKYEEKLDSMNDEIQQYETKIEEMVIKFKEEKFKLESDLHDSLIELESTKESQTEFKISLDEEYKRKLRKEKQTIETTLESLRIEITRLRENRQQLESQLQQNAHYRFDKDSGYTTTHAQSSENILKNKEIFNRIENEYQQQLQREKEYYDTKIRDLEDDYESLTKEISQLKSKYRQERIIMKSEFEKEKTSLEDKFEREKRDLQASMHLRLHNMRDPRLSQHIPRNINATQRNIRLQSEIDMLQQKVSRLEDLSPRIVDMAQRTTLYGGQSRDSSVRFQSSYQRHGLQVPLLGHPAMHSGLQYELMSNEMINHSRSLDVSPRYSGIAVSGYPENVQVVQNDAQQFHAGTSSQTNEVMADNNAVLVDNACAGEYQTQNDAQQFHTGTSTQTNEVMADNNAVLVDNACEGEYQTQMTTNEGVSDRQSINDIPSSVDNENHEHEN